MPPLKQALGRFDLTMIAIGSTIGSGIFLTPSTIAHELQTPWLILAVWIVGGLMAIAGALTFAELAGLMPGSGGVYVYLSEAYGSLAGFLYGWAYLLVVNTGGVAALAVAFATYFGVLVPSSAAHIPVVAIAGIVVVTVVNILGVKIGGIFSDIFTVLKLGGILSLIVVGIGWGTSATTDFSVTWGEYPEGLGNALAVAMVGVLWSYGGWQHASFAAAEAKNPRSTVPFAMVIGALVVAAVYVLANIAYMFLIPPEAIGASSRVAADAISVILGPQGAVLIAAAIFISTFGTAGIYTLTAPRIYFAMAHDGMFFKTLASVHPRFRTPVAAIIVQSSWAIVLILFWETFDRLISYVVFTDWIFFALAGASIFVFRRRSPDTQRLFKTPGYPFTPLFFTAVALWFIVNTFIQRPEQAIAGIGFLALGIPVFFYWKNKRT